MIKTEAYKDPANGDRWTLDVDPRDEVNYAPNVAKWLIDSRTTAVSFTPAPSPGVDVLEKDDPQGLLGELLPVKLKVDFTDNSEQFLALAVTTADGQLFHKTVWFKEVKN